MEKLTAFIESLIIQGYRQLQQTLFWTERQVNRHELQSIDNSQNTR